MQYIRNVTEKLLTYALGRGVEYQDMPLVRRIVRDSAPTNYRFSSLVMSIVHERCVPDEHEGCRPDTTGGSGNYSRRGTRYVYLKEAHSPARPSSAAPA